jgi:hypothetical protein
MGWLISKFETSVSRLLKFRRSSNSLLQSHWVRLVVVSSR